MPYCGGTTVVTIWLNTTMAGKPPLASILGVARRVNVASYKNVDEEAVLGLGTVRYVPLVGKVTVAMLERNLLRLRCVR